MKRHEALRNEIGRLAHRLGLSDGVVAEAAGLSRAHLNRIKNGRVVPRVDVAIAVARALHEPVRHVFRLRDSSHAR